MKKIIVLSLLLLIGTIALAGCGLSGGTRNTPADTVVNPMPAVGLLAEVSSVNIQNFAFYPATLTIKKGATVTWTNNDSAPHQIKAPTFNSSMLGQGQNFSFTFNEAGVFDYICAIHHSMTGKIIVE